MPTLVPRRTRRRWRCRTQLRRAAYSSRTDCQRFLFVHPKVYNEIARAEPFRFLSRPEGRKFPLDGNADDLSHGPRKDCTISRRRLLMVPRKAPRGFPFCRERLAVFDQPRRTVRPQPVPVVSRDTRRFPVSRWAVGAASTEGPEGLPALDAPKGVEDLLSSIVVAPLGASTPDHPKAAQGPSGPRGARRDLPDGRIWQIPQK